MVYSTGRGGAGNIQTDHTLTSHDNHASSDSPKLNPTTSTSSQGKKHYYSTGRGGAGNIQLSDSAPSPQLVPQGSHTPSLHTAKITTGRGGYGNMVDNKDPELTRKLQDVDGPKLAKAQAKENELYAVASNKSFSVGRGGFGNVVSHTKSNGSGSNNLMAVTSRGEQREKKNGFLLKVKNLFN